MLYLLREKLRHDPTPYGTRMLLGSCWGDGIVCLTVGEFVPSGRLTAKQSSRQLETLGRAGGKGRYKVRERWPWFGSGDGGRNQGRGDGSDRWGGSADK